MTISVRIPTEKIMISAINWSFAKCSCPSWSAYTDESALRSSLASLDDCNSSLHWWFGFWTFLVALGVVLEVVFVVWEYLDELHDFRRGIIHAPERPQTALFVVGLFGAGLVAAGVSGELWKESQIATVETCIRKGNDALFLLLSKEAGEAAKSAKTAHEEADAVGQEAAALKIQLGAVAKRATDIDFNLGMTQWALSERYVLDSDALVKQLRQFKGQSVYISSYVTGEGYFFCSALYFFAHSAEMNAANGCETVPLSIPPSTGVAISGPDIQQTLALSQILLHTTNLGPSGVASAIKAPVLSIFVGVKSPFVIPQARGAKAPTQNKTNKQNAKP
jgi:hypothetical protein